MGINRTLNNFKGFTFGGVSSKTYGVYLTGEAVYNAPEREVEMIAIPGRNGMFALDRGRFENIEVTYRATIAAKNEADFREAISGLRNALCSQIGYAKLEDEYNPDEYRMAVYKSGLDVSPTLSRLGEFDIVFDCKPQRFLTSGETKQRVTSGADITNPTLFNSSPLLEAYGYGKINLGDETVEILPSQELGHILIAESVQGFDSFPDYSNVNTGDSFSVEKTEAYFFIEPSELYPDVVITDSHITSFSGISVIAYAPSANLAPFRPYWSRLDFIRNSSPQPHSGSFEFEITIEENGQTTVETGRAVVGMYYKTATGALQLTVNIVDFTGEVDQKLRWEAPTEEQRIGEVWAESTKPTGGDPTYIDLDIGEAYKIEDGAIMSLNNYTKIPAELPTLKPGDNEITFDDTITALDITPRWWKI